MKSYTDLEQSKKLAEILPLESADMYYCYGMDIHTKKWDYDIVPTIIDTSNQIDIDDIPCWSLAALLNIIEVTALFKTTQGWVCHSYIGQKFISSNNYYDNALDAYYEMILKLKKKNLL